MTVEEAREAFNKIVDAFTNYPLVTVHGETGRYVSVKGFTLFDGKCIVEVK